MKLEVLNKERFFKVCETLKVPPIVNLEYIYELYETVMTALDQVFFQSDFAKFTPINNVIVILYLINEYLYTIKNKTSEEINNLLDDDNVFNQIASLCADKYLTNEQLNYRSQAFLSRFNPQISTLELYLNFCLRTLESFKPSNKGEELIFDMLTNAFKLSKCIITLLLNGFETEAFSTWRTLHENESILIVNLKYGDEVLKEYIKHITYALAYRGQIKSKEETDLIFQDIKKEMKEHDLKSKDMKKFIEYGYLFKIPNIELNKDFKLNFRDGVQKLANLSMYSKIYETASEIAHSSPLLLFSRRDYFFNLTIINLYETFFRLEIIFEQIYRNKKQDNNYLAIRKIYLTQLKNIKEDLNNNFLKFLKPGKKE